MWRRVGLAVVALLSLAACSSDVSVAPYETDQANIATCDALYGDAPQTVDGQKRRSVQDDLALAWGEDPIILRCGVNEPAGLTRSSRCDVVDGVGWFTTKDDDAYTFTTIGRTTFVSVEVPRSYEPAADVLVDLATTVKKHDPVVQPCV